MTWRAATAAMAIVLLLGAGEAQAQWRAMGGRGGGARMWGAAQPGGGRGGGYSGPGGRRFGGYGGGQPFGGYASPAFDGPPPGGGYGRGGPYGGGWRRGQVLPPEARGAYVPDPGRYHLRAAPPGYGWVGDGRDAYLTQRSTGMVLDRVPGAYEPAPAWRGGGGRGRRPR